MSESINALERWGERSCSFSPLEISTGPAYTYHIGVCFTVYFIRRKRRDPHALQSSLSGCNQISALCCGGGGGDSWAALRAPEWAGAAPVACDGALPPPSSPGRLESNRKEHRGPLSRALRGFPPQATQPPREIGAHPCFFSKHPETLGYRGGAYEWFPESPSPGPRRQATPVARPFLLS